MMERGKKRPIIRMYHVHKRYDAKSALTDITLEILENEFVLISGASGAGKTTLLKLIYRGESATEGQVLVDGMNLPRVPRKRIPELRRRLGIIFQDYKLIPDKTAFENVALVLEAAGQPRRYIEKKVKSVLRGVGMEEKAEALPPSLSGGEQQRVAVARAIIGDPKIILADEPTGNLDPDSAGAILALLEQYRRKGATLLVATHDRELIRNAGGRVIQLDRGRLIADR
jgi:cell division transport system ATP-binding protein